MVHVGGIAGGALNLTVIISSMFIDVFHYA